MVKRTDFIEVTPYMYIHIDALNTTWRALTFSEIEKKLESCRKALKKSIGHYWDNTHYIFTSCNKKKPIFEFIIDEFKLSLWTHDGYHFIGSFFAQEDSARKDLVKILREWVERIEEGKLRCGDCGRWIEKKDAQFYSFTGVVCNTCYDSKSIIIQT